jgi:hypothetical protein
MAKQNINPISPFLVTSQSAKLDGAEKALIKLNAASFPEELHSLFSFSLLS